MDKIELTPEALKPYSFASKPLRITFQKRIISISGSMAHKMSLKQRDRFIIEIEGKKLFFKISVNDKGFTASSMLSDGRLTSAASGILLALFKNGIIKDSEKTVVFELGDFKEGRWELKLHKINPRNK